MKICNYCVHNFKLIAGINEDIRPSRASRNGPRTRSSSLKRANRRCADRNDTAAFFLCRLNKFCCLWWYRIKLSVHNMIFDHINMNRTKCTKSDMQRDKTELDALLTKALHKCFCKMESRCRSRCRSFYTIIYCLIALTIFERLMYIGRKRHRA